MVKNPPIANLQTVIGHFKDNQMTKALLNISVMISIFLTNYISDKVRGNNHSGRFSSNQKSGILHIEDSMLVRKLQGRWLLIEEKYEGVTIEGNLWTIDGFFDHHGYKPYYNISIEHKLDNCGGGANEIQSILLVHQSEKGQPNISYELISITDSTFEIRHCPGNELRRFVRKK